MVVTNCRPRNIQALPRELVEIVFDIHVNFHCESRYSLLLTSRMWYAIATTYPALWKSIAFCCKTDLAPETVLCSDLESLALAVNRTGKSQFELYFGETFTKLKLKDLKAFINSIDKAWLSRCRVLTIFPQAGTGHAAKTMGDVLFSGGLDNLEVLDIRHSGGKRRWEYLLQKLMEKIDSSAHRFRNLRVQVRWLPDGDNTVWITRHIYQWPNTLGRLTEVTFRDTCEPIPWEHFTKIHKIEVWRNDQINSLVKPDMPVVRHLKLGGINGPNSSVSPEIWNQLTHLTIEDSVDEFGPLVLRLPSLISLGIIVCFFNLRHIEAPKLEELTLRLDRFEDISDQYQELYDCAPFTPRVIHIDVQAARYPEKVLRVFATKLPLWSKVEELRLRHLRDTRYMEFVLIDALADETSEQCYPKLHSLTVLFPVPEWCEFDDRSDEGKASMKRSVARDIVGIGKKRATHKKGREMTKLEVGWYIEYGDDDFEYQWRIVEWKDCLCRQEDEDEDEDEGDDCGWYTDIRIS